MQTQMAEAMNKALVAQDMKPKTPVELIWRYMAESSKKPGSPVMTPLPYPPLAEPQPSLAAAQPDDLDERINKMSVGEARATYVKLKAIFG